MDVKPDTIKVSAFHKEEIFASYANLYVTVKGSSIISGNEAMKKAREVSQLVEALTRFGLSPDSIQLQGVRIDTASGALLRSSSASYGLKIKTETLDQFPGLLDIIAEQKNAAVERVEWKYPEEAARDRGLESAIEAGKAKAEQVARALGVKLLGVYDFMENTFDEGPVPYQTMELGMATRAKSAAEPSLNMDIQHSKIIQVHVDIWYRVSPL
jgi:uncharacterized protein YggE